MTRAAGFSLLEIILALIIVALIMATIAPALIGTLHAQRQARAILEPLAGEQAMLAQLRDDVLAAPRPNGSLCQPLVITTAQIKGLRGDSLQLTTNNSSRIHPTIALRTPEVGQSVVTWSARLADDGHGLSWSRKRQANLLATGTAPEPSEEIMLDHLASVSIEAFYAGAFTNAYSSDDHTQILPAALRISFAYLANDGNAGAVHRIVIDLPQPALDPTQQKTGS